MRLCWHVPDLDLKVAGLGVLLQVDVDGEMGIDVAHLVLEALGHADDQVVDEGADCAEGGDVLADAMVDLDADDVLLDDGEGDGDVAQVLGELAAGALNRDEPRLDRDLDCLTSNASATARVYRLPAATAAAPSTTPPRPRNHAQFLSASSFCWRFSVVSVVEKSRVTPAGGSLSFVPRAALRAGIWQTYRSRGPRGSPHCGCSASLRWDRLVRG